MTKREQTKSKKGEIKNADDDKEMKKGRTTK